MIPFVAKTAKLARVAIVHKQQELMPPRREQRKLNVTNGKGGKRLPVLVKVNKASDKEGEIPTELLNRRAKGPTIRPVEKRATGNREGQDPLSLWKELIGTRKILDELAPSGQPEGMGKKFE